jgi:hypothetical protein
MLAQTNIADAMVPLASQTALSPQHRSHTRAQQAYPRQHGLARGVVPPEGMITVDNGTSASMGARSVRGSGKDAIPRSPPLPGVTRQQDDWPSTPKAAEGVPRR